MVTSRPWMAMRIAVMALRKAAEARMNNRKVIRVSHSSLSRRVIRPLLRQGRRRIVRELVFAGVGALDFEFAEEQRRADDRGGRTVGSLPTAIKSLRIARMSSSLMTAPRTNS